MGVLYITAFVFTIMIAFFSLSQVYAEPLIYDDDYIIEKLAIGLQLPTAMTFVGDDILVLEKNTGKVIRIQDNGVLYKELILDVPVMFQGESGLLGIASVSNHVFLYFTEALSGSDTYSIENSKNVVYQYDWDGEKLTNPILIKEFPNLTDGHHGGVITVGINNEVYFVIGDQGQRATFQNIPVKTIYENGSIFKIDTENNNNVELFAMGIRNSFGLAVDPKTGYLWETENGRDVYDEINLVKPRFNGGWVSIMGPADREYRIFDKSIQISKPTPKPFENFVYSDPEFSWYKPVAVTAIAFPDKDSFRKYSDWLFVGDFLNGMIYKFQLNADGEGFVFYDRYLSDLVLDDNDGIDEILFARDFQGVTDIKFHNGAMYVVVIGDGNIYKIYPKEPLSPLEQYQNGVTNKKIVCKPGLMPIMKKSSSIYCVYPKTGLTFTNTLNWSVDHPEMPKINLRNQDLQGLNFEYTNLSNSDFRRANFDTAKISNVNFIRANLSYIDLSNKDLTGTILTGADLSNSILTGVDLSNKDLTGTILTGVDLSNKDLTGTILTGADLSDRDLSNVILIRANLENAILKNSMLLDANLDSANLTNADLRNTLLADANLSNAILKRADLSNAVLTGVILAGADLENAILIDTILNCVGHPICTS